MLKGINTNYNISVFQAMQIPVFVACLNFIASSVSILPVKLYSEKDNEVTEITNDSRLMLLNDDTGDLLSCCDMFYSFVRDYFLHGAGYIYVNNAFNKIKSLNYVRNQSVSVNINADPIFKQAVFMVQGKQLYDFNFIKIVRNTDNGVTGRSIIEENSIPLSTVYSSLIYENNLVKSGGNKKGFLQSEKRVSKEVLDGIKKAWAELYANNENNVMVLNEGLKFQESSNTSVELQLNEHKKTNSEQICDIFGLSPEIISGKATADEYVSAFRTACLPIVRKIETELNKVLLLEAEKPYMYFAFDLSEMLKGDILKRYQAYQIGLQSNFLQPDEIRYKEDLKPLGLDFIKLGLNDVLYNPKTKTVYTPNTDKTTTLTGE